MPPKLEGCTMLKLEEKGDCFMTYKLPNWKK